MTNKIFSSGPVFAEVVMYTIFSAGLTKNRLSREKRNKGQDITSSQQNWKCFNEHFSSVFIEGHCYA